MQASLNQGLHAALGLEGIQAEDDQNRLSYEGKSPGAFALSAVILPTAIFAKKKSHLTGSIGRWPSGEPQRSFNMRFTTGRHPSQLDAAPLPVRPEQAVRGKITGPVKFFSKLLDLWGLAEDDGAILLGFESKQDYTDILRGVSSLKNKDSKDRVRYLVKIRVGLRELFRNDESERMWLRERQPELGNESPLDLLLEGSFLNIIRVEQYVARISGR